MCAGLRVSNKSQVSVSYARSTSGINLSPCDERDGYQLFNELLVIQPVVVVEGFLLRPIAPAHLQCMYVLRIYESMYVCTYQQPGQLSTCEYTCMNIYADDIK